MGLAERRWAAERKEKDEATLKTRLDAIAGTDVALDIDWDAFSNRLEDTQYISNDAYGIPQLIEALEKVAVDDLGKSALKETLKRVVIKPRPEGSQSSFLFDNGTITWSAYFGSSTAGYVYADEMKSTIEGGL